MRIYLFVYVHFRAIYLRRSLKLKVAYYLILLVVWHLWLFFLLPSKVITKWYTEYIMEYFATMLKLLETLVSVNVPHNTV